MSPTVFRYKGYRFFFFSREEPRPHVHVQSAEGEVKFWLEPEIAFAVGHGLSQTQINELSKVTQEHRDEIINAWRRHFGG